jgi:16S rRNA (guanine966-N2)-methyltransferase
MAANKRKPGRGLRIIGGAWRSRRIAVPSDTRIRPTPDRVRETLFNWLASWRLTTAHCLDLYAGSGALGLEALSRGAAQTVFVERDPDFAAGISAACAAFGANAEVFSMTARNYLGRAGGMKFDLVFLDPPYDQTVTEDLAALSLVLAKGGLIYVERPAELGLPSVPGLSWRRKSRAAAVSFGLAEFAVPPDFVER